LGQTRDSPKNDIDAADRNVLIAIRVTAVYSSLFKKIRQRASLIEVAPTLRLALVEAQP
jgi:hypothetical protein